MSRGMPLLLGFCAAVFAAIYLISSGLWLWLGLGALVPAAVCLVRRRTRAGLALLGVALALLWCAGYQQAVVKPALEMDGRHTQLTMVLSETPRSVTATGYVLRPGKLPIRATVTTFDGLEDARIGDTFTVYANCSYADRLFKEQSLSYLSRGVFLLGDGTAKGQVTHPARLPWWCVPKYWGERLVDSICAAFPEDVSGFLTALVAGERSGVDSVLRTRLSRTGTSHLAAVSGMHVMFFVGLLSIVAGNRPRRRALICIPAVLFFVLMTGAAPSTVRAGAIQLLLLTAPLFRREADRGNSLAVALTALLLINPYSAANIGLQLSFAACLGLLFCTPAVGRWLHRLQLPTGYPWSERANRFLHGCWDVLSVTVGAIVFTLPLSMIYFGVLSLVAPAVNLLVVPIISLLFAAVLLVGLLGLLLPGPAAVLGWILAWPTRLVLGIISVGAAVPYGALTITDIYYPVFLVIAYVLGILAVVWKGQKRRVWVFMGSGAIVLLAAILFTRVTFHGGDLTVGVLDVGQGQCVVLSSAGKNALIDCGGGEGLNAGDVAADYLADRGESVLDYLILTHYHSDHSNGLSHLFQRVKVGTLVLPVMEEDQATQDWLLRQAQRRDMEVLWVTENTQVTLGEARLKLYAPLDTGSGSANERCLSVLTSTGDFRFLLTGDMSAEMEEKLAAQRLPRCQVLVVGHHGSAHSTGEALLDAVRPHQGIISVGANNDYGHPAQSTLERLQDHNVDIYRTDLSGTVTVTVTGG